MLQYVTEWRDIRAIWDTPTDPMERATARVRADQEYLRHALALMRDDPLGHLRRRLTRGAFLLWAAEVPIRYGDINATPHDRDSRHLAGSSGVAGAGRVGRRSCWPAAADGSRPSLLSLPIIYVTGVHLPLLCEARQSLPVKPVRSCPAAMDSAIANGAGRPTHNPDDASHGNTELRLKHGTYSSESECTTSTQSSTAEHLKLSSVFPCFYHSA